MLLIYLKQTFLKKLFGPILVILQTKTFPNVNHLQWKVTYEVWYRYIFFGEKKKILNKKKY